MTGRRQSTTESSAGADGARRRWLLDAAGRLRTALDRPAVRASLLSFAWPGLGQLAQRRPAVALVLAVPPLLLLIGVVAWVADAPEVFLLRLLAPGFGLAVVALIGLNAAWRVAAIVDAWLRSASRPLGHERSLPLVVALCLVVVVIHGAAGLYVGSLSPAIQPAFAGDASGVGPIAPPSPAVIEGIVTDVPNWGEWDTDLPGEIDAEDVIPDDGPLNVLILGVDWMPGRTHGLTDTIQVASFDQTSSRSAQISIPRDTGRFELFDGKMYSNRINSLLRYFDRRAEEYPDGAMASMARQIGYLLGIRIHYYALVNIPAFEQLVDMVGGIDYRLEHPIADGKHDFYIAAGKHHLNGRKA
ncbi:MAG TPA: LCP family protein, partial [Candidatus Limnocylindria bacterium]|nr:LCP family protein [Candidatus Limnocylindria bacterium]